MEFVATGELRRKERECFRERRVVVNLRENPSFTDAMNALRELGWEIRSLWRLEKRKTVSKESDSARSPSTNRA